MMNVIGNAHKPCRAIIVLSLLTGWLTAQDNVPAIQPIDFFESRVRPVLAEHCYGCHSQDSDEIKGSLQLDSRAGVLKGGSRGPVLVTGDPENSLLIQTIKHQDLKMPPGKSLTDNQISDISKWVAMGAPYPPSRVTEAPQDRHWSFEPIRDPLIPTVQDAMWPLVSFDAFLLARLEQAGLQPNEDADRYTWLRRVFLTLSGLPPTIDDINSFQQDDSAKAYERVVDRLLSSSTFGERWSRFWLDLVGYADQIGTSNNIYAEHAWRYRDYVISSFNHDTPYNDFVRQQIAGDLLEYPTVRAQAASITATGFLLLGDVEIVEADKAKLHVDIIDQQVSKLSKAFLALTTGCARCHDHKFDPISQKDYYAIGGFFHSTESIYKTKRGVWSDLHTTNLPETARERLQRKQHTRKHEEQISTWKQSRDRTTERLTEIAQDLEQIGETEPPQKLLEEQTRLKEKSSQLDRKIEHGEFFAPRQPRTYAVRDSKQPTNMQITIRGNPRALGAEVPRGFITSITAQTPRIDKQSSGRIALADWLVSRNNPLTARVVVNRIWQKIFGIGLVRTVDYFGVRGDRPSHPELLDHLATTFVQEGWSQKRLIRQLVLSRAFRMSSSHNSLAHKHDPDNRLLWRMSRQRLDAESLRDSLLAVSGQLIATSGGSAMPLEFPENVNNIDPTNVNPPSFSLNKWRPEQTYQRTIYLPVIRSGAQPGPAALRNVFDFTQPAEFAGQRAITAVPTQALFLMNSPDMKQHAENLAHHIADTSKAQQPRLAYLWMLTLNRPITDDEEHKATQFLESSGVHGWVELSHALLASNEFLMRL